MGGGGGSAKLARTRAAGRRESAKEAIQAVRGVKHMVSCAREEYEESPKTGGDAHSVSNTPGLAYIVAAGGNDQTNGVHLILCKG